MLSVYIPSNMFELLAVAERLCTVGLKWASGEELERAWFVKQGKLVALYFKQERAGSPYSVTYSSIGSVGGGYWIESGYKRITVGELWKMTEKGGQLDYRKAEETG